jgi:hypothetical protein
MTRYAQAHTSVVQYKVFKGHPKGAIVSLLEILNSDISHWLGKGRGKHGLTTQM